MRRLIGVATAVALVLGGTTVAAQPAAAAPVGSVQYAVDSGTASAAIRGITTYAAVIDRSTGAVLGRTGNAATPVASESVVKLFIAAYYLVQYGGRLPSDLSSRLRYMIVYSDDSTASSLWTASAVSLARDRYGLSGVSVATPRSGYWGATRITADAMAKFLYRAGKDPVVGPWLFDAMRATSSSGSDGYNQNLGFNTIAGAGSKQGWGNDNFTAAGRAAIHSVGVGTRYVAAVLQAGGSGTSSVMPWTATRTATLIDAAARGGAARIELSTSAREALADRALVVRARMVDSSDRPIAGQPIRFYSRTEGGAWRYRGIFVTDAAGRTSMKTTTGFQGLEWKAEFRGGAGFSSTRATTIVYVRRAITGVEKLPAHATNRQMLVIKGRTGVGYAGRKVLAQHITSKGYAYDGMAIVRKDGTFTIAFRTPSTDSVVYYRAYIGYRSGSYQSLTWSLVRRVIVR